MAHIWRVLFIFSIIVFPCSHYANAALLHVPTYTEQESTTLRTYWNRLEATNPGALLIRKDVVALYELALLGYLVDNNGAQELLHVSGEATHRVRYLAGVALAQELTRRLRARNFLPCYYEFYELHANRSTTHFLQATNTYEIVKELDHLLDYQIPGIHFDQSIAGRYERFNATIRCAQQRAKMLNQQWYASKGKGWCKASAELWYYLDAEGIPPHLLYLTKKEVEQLNALAEREDS